MKNREPARAKSRVVEGSTEEKQIRENHHVLYTANATDTGDNKISTEFIYCIEKPEPKTCNLCNWKSGCKLKKVSAN
jgi:hypothetical protein